jgi:hypothetical protein
MAESNSFKFGIIVILGLVALFFIYWFINSKNKKILMQESYDGGNTLERFENKKEDKDSGTLEDRMAHSQDYKPTTTKPMNNDLVGGNKQQQYSNDPKEPTIQQLRQAACFPKEMLTPEELKPQDNSSLWAQVNPEGEGSLKGRSFLQAGHHIGINTVGQTLRNANLQLRSEPPNPQVLVSPWNQTTIEPDTGRKPLEIGGCA